MTKEKLNEIKSRLRAATPGPWEWDVNSVHKIVNLMTTHSGRLYVMGFVRWGTNGAAPTFQTDKYMVRADKLLKSMPGKEHHQGYDDYIDHPDADLITNAPTDIQALLEYIEEIEGRYYTPKEYEAAFNKPWGDRDAIYYVDYADTNDVGVSRRFWRIGTLGEVKEFISDINNGEVLCATTYCPGDDYFHGGKG
jgi:hypothetical protein